MTLNFCLGLYLPRVAGIAGSGGERAQSFVHTRQALSLGCFPVLETSCDMSSAFDTVSLHIDTCRPASTGLQPLQYSA